MSEKLFIRLRTTVLTILFAIAATVVHAITLEPRAWECERGQRTIADTQYEIEICGMDRDKVGGTQDARLRVYAMRGALLAQRYYAFEPWSPLNQFIVGDKEILFTDADSLASDGTFEVLTLAFPLACADWGAANFERFFFDR
ncbi:hypothetical protein [Cupriavidus sp. SW-Y-13]|uniref:hypothetical protein n=1 Tax=Cupriavidus sp. SW-Y-13 TaxID=2653854 RepID=UPI001365B151|nr:hypothetical protein [Cupriavidus sp. SW-Y-13]MWL86336.1 hypothetical protein [Cupriavidus sp. SW-Y-13]